MPNVRGARSANIHIRITPILDRTLDAIRKQDPTGPSKNELITRFIEQGCRPFMAEMLGVSEEELA